MFSPLRTVLLGIAAVVWLSSVAYAGPVGPTYTNHYNDCVTAPNQTSTVKDKKQRWTISAGCDSYQNEYYERPTTQTYQVENTTDGEVFAAAEYYQNLDIVMAHAGVDENYLYVAIDLFGINVVKEDGTLTEEGLKYQYEVLISTSADGANGYWLAFTEGNPPSATYSTKGAQGQKDTNGDVGGSGAADGLSITKTDNLGAAQGNGYDTDWIDDGKLKFGAVGTEVLFTRLMPGDPSVIEFAIDYKALGFTQAEVQSIIDRTSGYFDVRAIKGGPKDPQNYMWNDEYTKSEAGSPYQATSGDLTKSEFGTQGLGNIYLLDTLHHLAPPPPPVPEPAGLLLLTTGVGLAWAARRRRSR